MTTPTTPPTPETPGTPDSPDLREPVDTTTDGTLADEVFVDEQRTAALPTWAPATPGGTGTATATAPAPAEAPAAAPAASTPPEPQWLKGPAPFALVLGLLGLVVAGSTLLAELTDVTLPWNDLGPWTVVAAGIVVLLVGAIGLRSSRNRG
jgi:hypothetical protein